LSLIRDTYLRFQLLVHEVAKFGVVGAIGFIIQVAIQAALYPKHTGALTSEVVGTVVAMVLTFLGSKYWTFKHREGKSVGHETVLFIVFNVLGLIVQSAIFELIIWAAGDRERSWYWAATVVGVGIATLFRLITYRKFVFRELRVDDTKPEQLATTSAR
jgi:putative flippase GtrA